MPGELNEGISWATRYAAAVADTSGTIPVLEKIALQICATLEAVTTTGAGGASTGLTVQRPVQAGNDASDCVVQVMLGTPKRVEEFDQQQTTWTQPFELVCYIAESNASSISLDTRIIGIRAAVEFGVAPPDTWGTTGQALNVRRRDGWAHDTAIENPILFDTEEGAFSGIIVIAHVNYSTAWNDPYTSTTRGLSD